MTRTALVLGAGMVGVSCALALQKRGFTVTLIDRREPGRETSYGNAGVLARSSIAPLNNPSLYGKLAGYLGNGHPALNLSWRRALTRPGWLLRFLWEGRPSQAAARIAALDSITASTVERHRALMAEAGVAHRLRENGTLKLWRSEAGHAAAQAEHHFLKRHGIASRLLDRQGISAVEPHLNPIFRAGLLIPSNASVDSPGAVTAAYAALFAGRGGQIVQAEVKALTRQDAGWRAATDKGTFEAGIAVVALGPWSGDLLKPLGLDPRLDVERGYHRHLKPEARATLSRPIYDVDAAYFMAPMEQGYRVTSGVDLSFRDAPDAHRQIDGVTEAAREAFPLGAVAGETWRGARPTLPDSLPMIGEAPGNPGLWLAFGNQHIGFSTGPITGEMIAAMVCGETPPADPKPFRPERYIG
ncbi:FAD-binding oxidoreductase [Bosea sp. SSUT16]|uniref:FAD-binding oxidoreductase n=1 Tax=Bosea spartocytisi TaxID=2773451 RepID=A0A927E7J5_9HYPH|nr:FAD-dependent oxidoreductase [Bosea spartocytisi]MBD3846213.1 FAD-binding oxidoreductase [Bosea spartocytisi]MCT4473397.1 FAD-binding oxidoreductase [Bosea spartocytisi]